MSTRILAIDTTTEACSAAIMIDNQRLLKRFIITPREHTQHILPMIDNLLAEAGVVLNELDALAFSCGPGSFTGMRIGIGIAKGLALGANLPLIGISTLMLLAEGAWRKTGACQVLTAIDARMGEVYWAKYQRQITGEWHGRESEIVASPKVLKIINKDIIGNWATAGTGWQTYPTLINQNKLQLISGKTLLPNACDMLPIALYYFHIGNAKSATMAQLTYLRNKVVT